MASANLTVSTKTGTFVGNLNDTYPAVRQFKYVPYAKVWMFNFCDTGLTNTYDHSRQLAAAAGPLLRLWTHRTSSLTPQSLVQHAHNMSLPSPQRGH